MLRIKRVYEPRETSDGTRLLVMRYWPRGIRSDHVDEWDRRFAPSKELLAEFQHHGLPWVEYAKRYWAELPPDAVDELRRRSHDETITLLCSCKNDLRCHRRLLHDAVVERRSSEKHPGSRRRSRARS